MNLKKFPLLIFAALFFLPIIFNSCSDDDDTITSPVSDNLNGKWQFTLMPQNDFVDTITIKGKSGADFSSTLSVNDEIYLYEASGDILGYSGPFELRGVIRRDSINIDVYEPVKGLYGQDTTMIKSSEMTLRKNIFGHLQGTGKNMLDWDSTGVINDTYTINGIKLADIDAVDMTSVKDAAAESWTHKLCDVVLSGVSFVTGILTDGVFRPMGSCWGDKNGGGYYVFGHEGPGSVFPYWTQTAYYPMEWSWCKVRRYKFDIKLEGSVLGIQALKDLVSVQRDWLRYMGYDSTELALEHIQDFYNTYGDFGITIAYSTETRNASVYVNNEAGSTSASSHPLPRTIRDAIKPHFHDVFIKAGRDFRDEWHLRRSDFFVCNSPLVFAYIFGTSKVDYD